ncbi:MAG: ABC transporter ATP-binding protein [Chloroflexi bacterium]|nr:ABC transporter ATP-binding protein [Chloroflexota bacterium]
MRSTTMGAPSRDADVRLALQRAGVPSSSFDAARLRPPALELRNVRASYHGREVLHGIDLIVEQGERIALIGPNGAGKSTLLRCATGTTVERHGDVLLAGEPVERLSRQAVARRVAVVPQQPSLPFATRVEQLVALGRIPHEHPLLGLRDADREAVGRAIDRVRIGALVGRDARELSLGERQLVLLAMAVAQETPCLLLDEPTVHLDLRHQAAALELLAELNERDGVTVVAVLHDVALAAHFFPRLVVLDGGRIAADGGRDVVLAPDVVRRVFGVDPALVARPGIVVPPD